MNAQRGRPDPKPEPRIIDPAAMRIVVSRARSCVICGRRSGQPILEMRDGRPVRVGTTPALSAHHIVPRGQGGDDVEANLVAVCGHGTIGCHGLIHGGGPRGRWARGRLRAAMTAAQTAYVEARKGTAWLDLQYPSAAA